LLEFLTVSGKDPPFCFPFSIVHRDHYSCAHRRCSRGGLSIEIDDVPVSLRKNQQLNFSIEVFSTDKSLKGVLYFNPVKTLLYSQY